LNSQSSQNNQNFFDLNSTLNYDLPGVFGDLQSYIQSLFNAVANIPGDVLSELDEVIGDAFAWVGQHVIYRLVLYMKEVNDITEQWVGSWDEPWKTIAKLFLFAPAFAYKNIRDYVEPKLNEVKNDVTQVFTSAFNYVGDTLSKVFSPVIDPAKSFFSNVKDFFTVDVPKFFVDLKDFFTGIKDRLSDFASWLENKASGFVDAFVNFVTKDVPDLFKSLGEKIDKFGESAKNFIVKDLPEYVKEYLGKAKDFIESDIVDPVLDKVKAFWSTVEDKIATLFTNIINYFRDLPNVYEREGLGGVIGRIVPILAMGATVAVSVDLLSFKIAGSGIDPHAIRQLLDRTVFKFLDLEVFTSVFLAIAVQKPLEYAVRRMFRTERPKPSEALNLLAKNLINEDQALDYLRIAGYPDDEAATLLRSIYREPSFDAVFTAYRRGKIDEREYRSWLSILNVDKAETLSGTLYPYKVLEEANYRVPNPTLLAYAAETGEISEDMIKQMLSYEMVHPEFIDVAAKALMWRAAKDERSLLKKYAIDNYIDGSISDEQLQHYLGILGISGDLTGSILEVAGLTRHKSIRKKALSYLEQQFLQGYMSRDDFIQQLISYGYDQDLIREYATLLQYIRDNYMVIKETKDERSALKSTLVNKYKQGMIDDETLEQELRKLNLNDIEIQLTISRAKLEFDAEQKNVLFNDLIEKLKQGLMNKSEFTDQCQRLGIQYDRCTAYANYYWSKYIGDEFFIITKDERSSLATSLIKKYVMGFMTEDELRAELKKLMYTDEEIELRIKRATVEDEVKYLDDLLAEADALLKKGEIDPLDYIDYLTSLGMRRDRAEARANKILASMKKAAK